MARIEEYRSFGDVAKKRRVERYKSAQHESESESRFWRYSGRYPLTATGKFNTYALFAEVAKDMLGRRARFGLILQSGIGTDVTSKAYLDDLVRRSALISFFDFVNLEGFFPGIHRTHPHFCAITVSSEQNSKPVDCAFYLTRTDQLSDRRRRFQLNANDLRLFNPNTGTCPTFRTSVDAALCKSIYNRIPVLLHCDDSKNEWKLRITRIFNMGVASVVKHRRTQLQLDEQGLTRDGSGNFRQEEAIGYWRVYESKMIHQYNHRYASYSGCTSKQLEAGQPIEVAEEQLRNPNLLAESRYWLPEELVAKAYRDGHRDCLMAFRDVTNATNERTMIATLIPFTATDLTLRVLITNESLKLIMCLLANFNSMVFDYLARQFVAGMHLSDYVTEQLPVLKPSQYSDEDIAFVTARVAELTITADDLVGIGESQRNTPFDWNVERRLRLEAELDGYYANLYGLTRDELRYILDPKDVFGDDFPSETFRVLQEREEKQCGEYRTRRLVLEAYDQFANSPRFHGEMLTRKSVLGTPKGIVPEMATLSATSR